MDSVSSRRDLISFVTDRPGHDRRYALDGSKLKKLGCSYISYAITQYHGGFHNFRKILGEEQQRNESGLWKNLNYTIQQAQKFMEQNNINTLPSHEKLLEMGRSDLGNAISKYHRGYRNFREILRERQGFHLV